MSDLNSAFLDIDGHSRQVLTTIFTMRDDDRFSGKLLNAELRIQGEYIIAAYEGADINRIDFAADDPSGVTFLRVYGDQIQGVLLTGEISIEQDSFEQLTADKSKFNSIQFNAGKLLLKNTVTQKPRKLIAIETVCRIMLIIAVTHPGEIGPMKTVVQQIKSQP